MKIADVEPKRIENEKIKNIKTTTQTKLNYNVLMPKEKQQTYYPMLDFNSKEDGVINELELIRTAVEIDRLSQNKSVTSIYIFSPPGLGKTVMGGYLARCYKCPYQIINCVNSMIDLDLLGSQVLIGDETIWQDGPIPSIIRAANDYKMGILIINELNALSVNAQMALNPLLDKQQGVVLTQNNNEFVGMEEYAHLLIIASMNPDVLGINDLQDSVRDRASLIFQMTYPPIKKEASLVAKILNIDEEITLKFCEVIDECRRAKFVDHTVSNAPSTRSLIDWIQYSRVWGPKLSFEMTIANRYSGGVSDQEGMVYNRIAHGKGITTWKFPDEFYSLEVKKSIDDFHFPSIEPVTPKPKPRKKRVPKDPKERKKYKAIEKAKVLNLKPLDTFVSHSEKK